MATGSAVAAAECGTCSLPPVGLQDARLLAAASGVALLDATGATQPAPPPPPLPSPDPELWQQRLAACQREIDNLEYKMRQLQEQAAPYEARYAALPALRAYTSSVPNAASEALLLRRFEREAADYLRHTCGAGPQGLLQARLVGLQHEADMLTTWLAALPPPA